MKKTIAALAIIASGSLTAQVASAIARPTDPSAPRPKISTACLGINQNADESVSLSSCDSASNNKRSGVELKQNGCAEGQAAIRTLNKLAISSCMPPGMVQL